jgi:hypothetical protein
MNKSRRILLLIVDIITALGGVVALVMFFALKPYRGEIPMDPAAVTALKTATVAQLQSELRVAADSISFLNATMEDATRLVLVCGLVMLASSALRLMLTPARTEPPGK